MFSALPMAMQRAIRVRNTFIDEVDAGDGDEQPTFLPRSRTQPLPLSMSQHCTGSSCVRSSPERPSGYFVGEQEQAALASPHAAAGPELVKRTVRCCVKNTFIADVDEDCDEEQPRLLPRSRTEPFGRQRSLESTDCGSDLPCDDSDSQSDSESDEAGAACFFEEPADLPAHTPFATVTPTPWPEPREGLELYFFPEPVAAQAPPPAAPVASCVAPLPAQQTAPGSQGARARTSISARDKSLAVRQEGGACRVEWSVDAKKLRGSEKQAVSPPLEVSLGPGAPPATFKLMLCPSGGDSFRKAGGVGQVQLKCCSDLPESSWPLTAISISVGGGRAARGPRGPFAHRFGSSSVFSAPREQADWDFGASVEAAASVVAVAVEMAPCV